jgi:hypothetical protein
MRFDFVVARGNLPPNIQPIVDDAAADAGSGGWHGRKGSSNCW